MTWEVLHWWLQGRLHIQSSTGEERGGTKRREPSRGERQTSRKASWFARRKVWKGEGNDKMLHFKLTTPGSIHHTHGWILPAEVSLKWRKIHIESDNIRRMKHWLISRATFLSHKNSPGGLTPHLDSKLQKSQLWNNCKQNFLSLVLHHGAMFIPNYVSFNGRFSTIVLLNIQHTSDR